MEWLAENWFFVLVIIAFIALHLFGHGHGRHGGDHGGHRRDQSTPPPDEHKRSTRRRH